MRVIASLPKRLSINTLARQLLDQIINRFAASEIEIANAEISAVGN